VAAVDTGPLGFPRRLCLGLCRRRHEGDQGVPDRFLHRVLRRAITGQAVDDRADDYAPRHELADDLGDVGVVAA